MSKNSGRNSYDTIHQKIAGLWMPACNEVHGCDNCPVDGISDDNRIENLQLVTDERHKQITILENEIARLKQRLSKYE
jgi:hypothetical protein